MRAKDLHSPYPIVRVDTPAREAARLLAAYNLPGLIVVDETDHPTTILPGTQVLRMALPSYCLEDPTLAGVVDEDAADAFFAELGERTVADALPSERRDLAVVTEDATALQIAALMATTRTPVVAVIDGDRRILGAITLDALLDRLLGS